MSDIWETVWDVISETFQRIAVSLKTRYPQMSWSSGHSDNSAFPFRAYVAFNQGFGVDVVASVDFHRSEGILRYSADIGLDDGRVLADGPTGVINVANGLEAARAEIEAAVGDVTRFLEASGPTLQTAIGKRKM